MVNIFIIYRMERCYEIFREYDFRNQLRDVLSCMLDAYCDGQETARVYTHSIKLFNYLECWSRGWYRRAGYGGIWKDSQGNSFLYVFIKNVFLIF